MIIQISSKDHRLPFDWIQTSPHYSPYTMRGLKKKIRFNFLIHCPDSWEFLHLISSVNRMFVEAKLHFVRMLRVTLIWYYSSKVQFLISKCEFSKMGFHLSSWHFLITNTWQKFKHKDWPMTAKQMNLTFKKKLRSSFSPSSSTFS